MKYLKIYLFLIVSILFTHAIKAQQRPVPSKINIMIEEVYGQNYKDQNPLHYKRLQELLQGRVIYVEKDIEKGKEVQLLSTVPLLNKKNPKLKRDQNFNPATFNPLKYDLVFFPKKPAIYRFDGQNILIVINPQ